jgi:hypothetical protein
MCLSLGASICPCASKTLHPIDWFGEIWCINYVFTLVHEWIIILLRNGCGPQPQTDAWIRFKIYFINVQHTLIGEHAITYRISVLPNALYISNIAYMFVPYLTRQTDINSWRQVKNVTSEKWQYMSLHWRPPCILRTSSQNLVLSVAIVTMHTACFNIAITIVDIIHRPVFYLKYNVSETGFCLRIQAEPTLETD